MLITVDPLLNGQLPKSIVPYIIGLMVVPLPTALFVLWRTGPPHVVGGFDRLARLTQYRRRSSEYWFRSESMNSSSIRGEAAYELGKLGDPRAIPVLLACLDDESGFVQQDAVDALVRLGGNEAIAPLRERLCKSHDTAKEVAFALLGLDPRGVAEWSSDALKHSSSRVREAVVKALVDILRPRLSELQRRISEENARGWRSSLGREAESWVLSGILKADQPGYWEVVEVLISASHFDSKALQGLEYVKGVASNTGVAAAISQLLRLSLPNTDAISLAALKRLSQARDDTLEWYRVLRDWLRDPQPPVRLLAANVLEQALSNALKSKPIPDKFDTVFRPCQEACEDSDRAIRKAARAVLARAVTAAPELAIDLKSHFFTRFRNDNQATRMAAAEWFAECGDAASLRDVLRAECAAAGEIRGIIAAGLFSREEPALEPLVLEDFMARIRTQDQTEAARVVKWLAKHDNQEVMEMLIAAISAADAEFLEAIGQGLGQSRNSGKAAPEIVGQFLKRLSQPHDPCRDQVVQWLGAHGGPEAVGRLLNAWSEASLDLPQREQLADALVRLGRNDMGGANGIRAQILDFFRARAGGLAPELRVSAAEILGGLEDDRAVPLLYKLFLEDSELSVQQAASAALDRIEDLTARESRRLATLGTANADYQSMLGSMASSLVAGISSHDELPPGRFRVVVVETLFNASMNVKMLSAVGAATPNVLYLAVMCFDEPGGEVLKGEDKEQRWWNLSEVEQPAVLYVPRETLPYLQQQRRLWERVLHCE